jgi:hypothetical protein
MNLVIPPKRLTFVHKTQEQNISSDQKFFADARRETDRRTEKTEVKEDFMVVDIEERFALLQGLLTFAKWSTSPLVHVRLRISG